MPLDPVATQSKEGNERNGVNLYKEKITISCDGLQASFYLRDTPNDNNCLPRSIIEGLLFKTLSGTDEERKAAETILSALALHQEEQPFSALKNQFDTLSLGEKIQYLWSKDANALIGQYASALRSDIAQFYQRALEQVSDSHQSIDQTLQCIDWLHGVVMGSYGVACDEPDAIKSQEKIDKLSELITSLDEIKKLFALYQYSVTQAEIIKHCTENDLGVSELKAKLKKLTTVEQSKKTLADYVRNTLKPLFETYCLVGFEDKIMGDVQQLIFYLKVKNIQVTVFGKDSNSNPIMYESYGQLGSSMHLSIYYNPRPILHYQALVDEPTYNRQLEKCGSLRKDKTLVQESSTPKMNAIPVATPKISGKIALEEKQQEPENSIPKMSAIPVATPKISRKIALEEKQQEPENSGFFRHILRLLAYFFSSFRKLFVFLFSKNAKESMQTASTQSDNNHFLYKEAGQKQEDRTVNTNHFSEKLKNCSYANTGNASPSFYKIQPESPQNHSEKITNCISQSNR